MIKTAMRSAAVVVLGGLLLAGPTGSAQAEEVPVPGPEVHVNACLMVGCASIDVETN